MQLQGLQCIAVVMSYRCMSIVSRSDVLRTRHAVCQVVIKPAERLQFR